jgi:cobaltochelatase CobN
MHLLTTTSASLDDLIEPVDLAQSAGDLVVLSFADSDLTGLAAAWKSEKATLPSVRLAHLRDLRHPMSIDLWIDRVAAQAKVIVVRLLGGLDWWRYGIERLSALAREHAITFAALPGEDRDDPRLVEASTLPPDQLSALLQFFREGGRDNMRALLRELARHAGASLPISRPQPVTRTSGYLPGDGTVDLATLASRLETDRPVVPIIFYRSMLLAVDTAPIDALYRALAQRGLSPAPLVVTSLKDADSATFIRSALARLNPAVIITTTAFAAGGGSESCFAGCDAPVLQVVIATTKRAAWRDSPRGLGAADLAMHVVLPELDGRVLVGAIAFKDPLTRQAELGFSAFVNRPEPDRIAMVAERVAALVRLQTTTRERRRLAVLMPDYPGAAGRTGYAVGLDVPASVVALLSDLADAGYNVTDAPEAPRALLDALVANTETSLPLDVYVALAADLPAEVTERIRHAWGEPADDPDVRNGAFRFRAKRCGNVLVALPPDRGRLANRRANYHDPELPPRHALLAFGLWLQHQEKVNALVHMGAHGTLEWLPGKAAALTSACCPEIVVGPLPILYPFIVSNPGEAAQAKRRIGAVTIGHLPPPLINAELSGDARTLERLVDEYAQADGLDRRRRERLARLIVESAQRTGLASEAGVGADVEADEALRRIDAWLCDLKDLAIKDGLHVYGRESLLPSPGSPLLEPEKSDRAAVREGEIESVAAERLALIAALDGKHIAPGPAGAPTRARRDVLPTGRNLCTADPRMLPTETAVDLGQLAADEVIRAYLQAHGQMPRSLVIDLWGSATLRTGGEEIAQGLTLMGCRPVWDAATGRVTGVEVLPTARIGRPRVDVTWRISGLFRDLFPAQIALINAAVQAVAARDEAVDENPLAAAHRTGGDGLLRVFGTAPGAYGAGIEDLLGDDHDRAVVGHAYLEATSYAYVGSDGESAAMPGAFAERVAAADMLLHPSDDPGRDLLEGSADVSFVGGFAAAAAALGRTPDLIMLDATNPKRPKARLLPAALARIVRGRAISPHFIAGQMRHGPRGAAELAETVDRLVGFAETADAVPGTLFDLLYDSYLADPQVRSFLLRENPAAARAIAERLASARRRGLWHPHRNDIDGDIATLHAEATP